MNVSQEMPGAKEARQKQISKWHAQGHDALDDRGVPRFDESGPQLRELPIAERIRLLRTGWPAEDENESETVTRQYGCARHGCDAVNPDYLSYGAYGKSWCLNHPPLRIRIRRWLGQDV